MHDDFEPISAIVERLMNGVAPAGEESTDATAQAETGGSRRAHHIARGEDDDVVIWCDFSGCRPPRGARGPAGSSLRLGGEAQQAPGFTSCPATGGRGNRVMRKT